MMMVTGANGQLGRAVVEGLLARLSGRRGVGQALDDARARAEAGDYPAALAIWGPLAQAGVARAQNNVGSCFAHGHGVAADPALALRWLTLSAENGDPIGQRNLATLHGDARDADAAARWFRAAAAQDDGEAQDMLSWLLLDGELLPHDPVEARRWAEPAARKGFPGAATRLGTILYNALGTERDAAAACGWWRRASDAGDADGAAMLGAAYHLGQGVGADQGEALFFLSLAERRGSLLAARFLPSVRARLSAQAIRDGERRAAAA